MPLYLNDSLIDRIALRMFTVPIAYSRGILF